MSIRWVHSARALRTHLSAKQFARGPRRDFDGLDALAGEGRVEGAGEFGVAVPDQEAEGADPVAEIHDQVAGLLGGPCTVRVGGHAEDVHVPGPHLHDEQHVQAFEEDRVHMKEIAGQQAISFEYAGTPARGYPRAAGPACTAGAQDPPYRCRADAVAEPAQLARHPGVSPRPGSPAPAAAPSCGCPGRPSRSGYVHLRVIRRR
jgi:hypothetical protein